jgi:hypothetical protein
MIPIGATAVTYAALRARLMPFVMIERGALDRWGTGGISRRKCRRDWRAEE